MQHTQKTWAEWIREANFFLGSIPITDKLLQNGVKIDFPKDENGRPNKAFLKVTFVLPSDMDRPVDWSAFSPPTGCSGHRISILEYEEWERNFPPNAYRYISFVGNISLPENHRKLEYAFATDDAGFIPGREYNYIASKDALAVYLTDFGDGTGHLVADCREGGWTADTFCKVSDGQPVKWDNAEYNSVENIL